MSDYTVNVQKHCKKWSYLCCVLIEHCVSFWLTGSEGAWESCDLQTGSPTAWKTQRTRLSLITVIFHAHLSVVIYKLYFLNNIILYFYIKDV